MNKRLLWLGTAFLGMAVTSLAQINIAADSADSGRTQWAPFTGTPGPKHLGADGAYWSAGDSWNDAGDSIVGDAGPNNQNFGLVLTFDSTSAFRTAVSNGNTVTLSGTSLFADGFGTQKTVGNVDWSKILVTFQAYGSSTSGDISNVDGFAVARAGNLDPNDGQVNTVYAYNVGPELVFDSDPYAGDATFTVDITSLLSGVPLDASNDRFMLGIFAYSNDGLAPLTVSDFDGSDDRIAFYSSSFQVSVPEPSTYAAIFGFLALAGVMIRRRLRNR